MRTLTILCVNVTSINDWVGECCHEKLFLIRVNEILQYEVKLFITKTNLGERIMN